MSIMDGIKSHPYLAAGGVAIGVLVIVLLSSGGGASTSVDGSTSDASNSTALGLAQIQGNLQGLQVQADAQNDQIAGQIELAKIQAGSAENIATLQQSVALATINAQSAVQTNHDTLAAQVQEKNIQATVDTARISSDTTIASINAVASAITQTVAGQTQVNMQLAQNQAPRSWLQTIFG